ncbi:MAG: DUF560 domain-containing protein [Alphaproteobacteria bacterium]|nr:DUF560 domain-containing protein [Alphaproteobacteria bacterium]
MKHFLVVFLCACVWLTSAVAESVENTETTPEEVPSEITMSALDAVKLAGNLIDRGDYEHANQILTMMPQTNNLSVELERWFLLAQMEQRKGNYEEAVRIYRKILDDQPDLARVRFELALCYMKMGYWYRADYHLRLAMAGKDLPEDVKQMMAYYRYVIRQNKRWNVWFNFGAAPDSNINNGNGGEECIVNGWGRFCRNLTEPESVMGANLTLGGSYEFVLSDHWRWKSDANLYSNTYNKHNYDDLYLSASTGPRYIWSRGDVWLATIGVRRWYGSEKYNYSYGAKIDTNYDWTRKLSSGLSLRYMENKYDEYGAFLNGQTYSSNLRLSYSFNARLYGIFRTGLTRETTIVPSYSYWQPNFAIGLGVELPYGFHVYAEPSFYVSKYDDPQWVVKDDAFTQVTERDFVHRYSLSISNNKFDVWGFVPTFTISYTKRDSNIWQREYDKTTLEFTMQQRF